MTDDAGTNFAIFSQVAAANKLCLVDARSNANRAGGQESLCLGLLTASRVSRASGQR